MDTSPLVITWTKKHRIRIPYLMRGRRRHYIPDILVEYKDGSIYLDRSAGEVLGVTEEYLAGERRQQLAEIQRRRKLYRAARPKAGVAGRSVIVTDDGLATGSTMMAALKVIRAQAPHELIVAVPVAPAERLEEVREFCDEAICLLVPDEFWAIGQFYEQFPQVEDEQVLELLQEARAGQGLAR